MNRNRYTNLKYRGYDMRLEETKDDLMSLDDFLKKYNITLVLTRRGNLNYRYTGKRFFASFAGMDLTDGVIMGGAYSKLERDGTPLEHIISLLRYTSEQKVLLSRTNIKEAREEFYTPTLFLTDKNKKEIEELDTDGESAKTWSFKND